MAVESHDKNLKDLLEWVEQGKAQLPDFQRSWVWDDTKICKLIESITSGFPMGAAMFLAYGGERVRFEDDEDTSLTAITTRLRGSKYSVQPTPWWTYEGKSLSDIYNETYPFEEE